VLSQVADTVRHVNGDDELRRVTPALLRRAEQMCPRRLKHEYESGKKLNRHSDARFEVSNRVSEDARLAHAEMVAPRPEAFVDPSDVEPEQRALYRAAATGYLRMFGVDAVLAEDIGRSTDEPELGVRLSGTPGLAVKHADGHAEVRVLRIGSSGSLLDDTDIRFTLLRAGAWAGAALDITAVDLLDCRQIACTLDVEAELPGARSWLAERITVIEGRVDRDRPVAGIDCRGCTCIPGCPALTASA
jgi:hypothetical protein